MNRAFDSEQFLSILEETLAALDPPAKVRAFAAKIASRSTASHRTTQPPAARVPVCDYLPQAMSAAATQTPSLEPLVSALRAVESALVWSPRPRADGEPPNFHTNHANAIVFGPQGLVHREDFRIGISVLAPHTTYPDHQHRAEEIYLVLSPGEWRNAQTDWHEPGIGGFVHNPSNIVHSMRANIAPLVAVWLQWLEE